jgi:Zn-dependent protease with chaperone function
MRRSLTCIFVGLLLMASAMAQTGTVSRANIFVSQPGPPVESDYDDDDGDSKFLMSISVPYGYDTDVALGIQQRVGTGHRYKEGTLYGQAEDVALQLLSNPKVAYLPYRWDLAIDNQQIVNAYSFPDGVLGVTEPLAKMISGEPGLWAAVLSHEIEHTARRHGVRMYIYRENYLRQAAYYEARVRAGDKNANWSLVGLRVGYALAVKKLGREQEHDADKQGMLLMARAGYHPDFVFAMHRMMMANIGDQGKFAAFFSDHPRWATRDERSQRAFAKALSVYQQMWPNPAESPGGMPPVVAFMGKPYSDEDKKAHLARVRIPIYCRNATEPVLLGIAFTHDGSVPAALMPEFRMLNGQFGVTEEVACPSSPDGFVDLVIPTGAVPEKERKLKAVARVFDQKHRLIEMSKSFDVKIPK